MSYVNDAATQVSSGAGAPDAIKIYGSEMSTSSIPLGGPLRNILQSPPKPYSKYFFRPPDYMPHPWPIKPSDT